MLNITYGTHDINIDVSSICYSKLNKGNYIIIPSTDHTRAFYFSDPLPNILKSIFITDNQQNITSYDHIKTIYIDTTSNKVLEEHEIPDSIRVVNIDKKLETIHSKLILQHGSFQEELPEQKMVVRYLTGNEKVLEIGGNIGRNTLIISSILKDNSSNLVVLESDTSISKQLKENRELNNMNFHIENSALSKRPLIQKGWDTMVSNEVLPGYTSVSTITYDDLMQKYNIPFDTLVLDCEGAFYYILQDMPEILNSIQLIIMENDYHNIEHKQYVDSVLQLNSFYVDYTEAGGWGPCQNKFFEVWKKNNI
jgi:FkbM family methyltransferase